MSGNNTAPTLPKYSPQKYLFLVGGARGASITRNHHVAHVDNLLVTCVSLLLDSSEGVWRHLWAPGPARATEVQELLVVFEEHLPRSLHSWPQPSQLWFRKITHPHQQLSAFQTSALRLATVAFHFGSPEAVVQFQSDGAGSAPETGGSLSFGFLSLLLPLPDPPL